MNIWFTSDTHFWHRGIIPKVRQQFASVEDMNEAIVAYWNHRVDPQDTVYHLGDVSFRGSESTNLVVNRLNGRIKVVPGNHDNVSMLRKTKCDVLPPIYDLSIGGQEIVLSHYPIESWRNMHHGTWMLHGHSHGTLASKGRRLDVGVDCWSLCPIGFEAIGGIMSDRKFVTVDHHTQVERE